MWLILRPVQLQSARVNIYMYHHISYICTSLKGTLGGLDSNLSCPMDPQNHENIYIRINNVEHQMSKRGV